MDCIRCGACGNGFYYDEDGYVVIYRRPYVDGTAGCISTYVYMCRACGERHIDDELLETSEECYE